MTAQMTDHERELLKTFKEEGQLAKASIRRCQMLLPEINELRIWEKAGFASLFEFAAKLAGMSKWQVGDAMRVLHKIKDKPALQMVAAEKGLARVRPIAAIATKEDQEFWAKKARDMSKNTLEIFVRERKKIEVAEKEVAENEVAENEVAEKRLDGCIKNGVFQKDGFGPRTKLESRLDGKLDDELDKESKNELDKKPNDELAEEELLMKLKPEVVEKLRVLKGQGTFNDLMEVFIRLQAEHERELKNAPKKPAPVRTESRHIPESMKQHVTWRSRGLCAFPGCVKIGKIFHHTGRWALERVHDPNKIHCLCEGHERLAHLGLIKNEDEEPENWILQEEFDPVSDKRWVDQQVWLHRKT